MASLGAAAVSASNYIGCKISLISKSDIRYEGVLYTLDQVASTVALSNVRSFGTEDRQPGNPIPGKDQIYEYILFRGTDIKDIVVCEAPRQELYPGRRTEGLTDPAILEATTSTVPLSTAPSSQILPGSLTASRPSAVHDFATSAGAIGAHVPPSLYSGSAAAVHARGRQEDADDTADQYNGGGRYRRPAPRQYDEDGYGGGYRDEHRGSSRGYGGGGYTDGYSRSVRGRPVSGQGLGYGYRTSGGDYVSRGGQQQSRGGYSRGGYARDDGQQRRSSQPYHQNASSNGQPAASTAAQVKETKDTLPEYDFENAERVFSELESQAKKLSLDNVGDGSADGRPKQEESAKEAARYYDPSSFFDKISCEALEKEKTPGARPDWKKERQVNSETFGAIAYRPRGQYQARGGFRGYRREGGGTYQQQAGGGAYRDDGDRRDTYRPRGGMRYNGGGGGNYSRSFVSSNPQRASAHNGGDGYRDSRRPTPEHYFRCPESPRRQFRAAYSPPPPRHRHAQGGYGRSVHYEDEDADWSLHSDDYNRRDRDSSGNMDAGRRRRNRSKRNRGGDAESGGGEQQSVPPRPKQLATVAKNRGTSRGVHSAVGASNSGQSEEGLKRGGGGGKFSGRHFRNSNRNAGGRMASSGGKQDTVDGNVAPGGSGQADRSLPRKRAARNKSEWVQYELPNDCKGLLPLDGATVAAGGATATAGGGVAACTVGGSTDAEKRFSGAECGGGGGGQNCGGKMEGDGSQGVAI